MSVLTFLTEPFTSKLLIVTGSENIDEENLKKHPKFLEAAVKGYRFEPIKEPTVVEVQGIPNGAKHLSAVKLYFSNEDKSGGIRTADFYGAPNPDSGFCLIDLRKPEVAKRVCEREHTIFGPKVCPVIPYYEGLGYAFKLRDNRVLDETEPTRIDPDVIDCKEPSEESVTDILLYNNKLKLKTFEAIGFKDDVASKTQVKIQINVNDGTVELTGLTKDIHDAKIIIMEKLESLNIRSYTAPNPDYIQILNSQQLMVQGNREIEKRNLRGVWEISSDSDTRTLRVCCEYSQKDAYDKIKEVVFGLIGTDVIGTDWDIEHTDLNDFKNRIKTIENSLEPFAKCKFQVQAKSVRITCRKDLMLNCRQQVRDVINRYLICSCQVSITTDIADYMHDHMTSQIKQWLQEECGEIPDWHYKDGKFHITGNNIVRLAFTEVLTSISYKVIYWWRSIELAGIGKYFASDAVTQSDIVSEEASCRWQILTKHEFQNQNVCSIALTEEGQLIAIRLMDLYKQSVDAIVHEMVEEEDQEHFRKGEDVEREISNYIEENGQIPEGQAFVTGPGKLPSLMIIHVRTPKWQGGMENEDKALRKTIENILATAESNKIRSIAMPIMTCTSQFRYPLDLASWILLQTIINLCPSKFQFIREIYICDTDGYNIHELQMLAERQLRSHCYTIPISTNVHLVEPLGSNPEYNTISERSGIITIPLPGDRKFIIAWGNLTRLSECTPPLQADIIVNPSTTFPVLTGRIAYGLKSEARKIGGFDLESECKKMEPSKGLKKGSFVTTDTPNMSCAQILHLRIEGDQRVINEDILNGYIKSCMWYAVSKYVKSIAFPTIGTGNIGYPRDLVAKCFIHTIVEYCQALTTESLEKVIVVIYHRDYETTMAFEQELMNLFAKRPHRLLDNIEEEEVMVRSDDDHASTATYSNIKVKLQIGKLEKSKADVIVNTTSSFPNLHGVIAQSLCKVAGLSLQSDCYSNYPNGLKDGAIASTSGGNLNCIKVFHIKLSKWNQDNGKSAVQDSVTKCLDMLHSDGLHSIAFPSIGTGGFNYPVGDVASAMFEAIKQFGEKNPHYKLRVNVVLYHTARDVNQAFNAIFSMTFQDVDGKLGLTKMKEFQFAGDEEVTDDCSPLFTAKRINIDPGKRDFVLVKFISDCKDKTESAFHSIKMKLERNFPRHEPLEHPVIGQLRQYDIKEIETKCAKLEVEVQISKKKNRIFFWGTSESVRLANREVLRIIMARHTVLEKNNTVKLLKTFYEWCYEETENILLPYSHSIGFDLECAFIERQKNYDFEEDGVRYRVDFSKFEEFQVGKRSNRVKVVRKDRTMRDIQPLPDQWKKMDKNTFLELIDLNNTDKEYVDVEANFRGTLGSFPIKTIHKIKRIQNRTLYQQYALKKKLIQNQNTNLQNVEMTLWHGTAHEHTDLINRSGFNRSFAGQTHGTVWYGKGVYFSIRSEYGCGDVYTKRDANEHKYIYQCKVLTGNSTIVTKGYNKRFPPNDSTTGRTFDSTSDRHKNEYVIFSDTQAYPEYLIEFE
ncbi:hypothetical protein ACJMK2_021048 [Sinanodonta woodiana]|uniref:Poly [ADP-ribose] polymerase n=1 Tax=Sinanodonta woodiana TaxID=1069815 RepID=A0ABD3U1F4_SINWO